MFTSLIDKVRSQIASHVTAREIALLSDRDFEDVGPSRFDAALIAKARRYRARENLGRGNALRLPSFPTA